MEDWPKFLTVYNFDQKLRYGSKGDGGYVIGDLPGSTRRVCPYPTSTFQTIRGFQSII